MYFASDFDVVHASIPRRILPGGGKKDHPLTASAVCWTVLIGPSSDATPDRHGPALPRADLRSQLNRFQNIRPPAPIIAARGTGLAIKRGSFLYSRELSSAATRGFVGQGRR